MKQFACLDASKPLSASTHLLMKSNGVLTQLRLSATSSGAASCIIELQPRSQHVRFFMPHQRAMI
jgi:hypothetical protein